MTKKKELVGWTSRYWLNCLGETKFGLPGRLYYEMPMISCKNLNQKLVEVKITIEKKKITIEEI